MSGWLRGADRELMLSALAHFSPGQRGRTGCPLCEAVRGRRDAKQSLYLHADGGWLCFRCGGKGYLPGTGPNAHGPARVILPPSDPALDEWRRPPFGFRTLYEGEGYDDPSLDTHRAYLEFRGLPAEVCRAAKVGGVCGGVLGERVVVPVFSPDAAHWWGWSARLIRPPRGEWEPVYRSPAAMPRTRLLYRQEALSVVTRAPVFVVEGAIKALHLWPHAVATLGKLTAEQLRLLAAAAERPVVFLADGDAWGPSEAQVAGLRAYGLEAGALRMPPRTDPNDYPAGLGAFLPYVPDALAARYAVNVPPPGEESFTTPA